MLVVSGVSLEDLAKALSGPPLSLDSYRASKQSIVFICPDTEKPHDWISQDIIDLNIEAFCLDCKAKFRYTVPGSCGG